MKKFIPILIALLLNTSVFSQLQIEKGLPVYVESTEVELQGIEKYEDFYFKEVIKFSEDYFVVRKSPKEGTIVLEKLNSSLNLIESINLSETLNVNGYKIIETKSLKDRLIIVTLLTNKKEKTQTCNAYTFTYENMSLSKKTELKTQFYKKEQMEVQIVTSHNDNILFKISEAENVERSAYRSHYILTNNDIEISDDYSDLINTTVTDLLKGGVFVSTPNIVLSNTNEVIMAGVTKKPTKSYFSGIIFNYSPSGAEFYDFEDKLPWCLCDNLAIKMDEKGILYGANYMGDENEKLVFFSFNTELMKPVIMYSETMDNRGTEISNIIPLANSEVVIIAKHISSHSIDNVHSAHYFVEEIVIYKIDQNGALKFQKSIEPKSATNELTLKNPVSCIVNGTELTLVYNSSQFNDNENALVGSVIDENGEMNSFKMVDYDNKSSNINYLELYQIDHTHAENMELVGLTGLGASNYKLIFISSEEE